MSGSRAVPDDALDLSRSIIASSLIHVSTACSSKVVVAIRDSSLSLVLVHFTGVQVFEQIALLALIITNIEGVACHIVLLLSVEVLDHRQRCVVIGTLLHGLIMLHTCSEAILVRILARRVSHRRLNPIGIGLHNFLARS